MSPPFLLFTLTFAAAPLADPPVVKKAEEIYRESKVGDWVAYRSDVRNEIITNKQTVTAKTDEHITIKLEQNIGGKEGPVHENKIPIKEDPEQVAKAAEDYKTEVEILGSGKETLTIAGKKYECEWVKARTTITFLDPKVKFPPSVTVTKAWRCPDVPLGGLVRMETETKSGPNATELTGFGRGP